MSLWFKGVKEPNGWMGNMAPYPITYNGQVWRTSEALFQSMRFNDPIIKGLIQAEESPMSAKMIAKKTIYRKQRIIKPMSPQDIANMEACVLLKFQQHPKIARLLMATGSHPIYEDASNRKGESALFWGAYRDSKNPIMPIKGKGTNMMGDILIKLRAILLAKAAQAII